ncbi:uncharacterized protein LOC124166739 isoform X1 [Ischnura elegans]|uniref:uncharacterized protein LOC124166739 isoform X1 n=1 Tax=Ischnura elegans TaxID=197161 RepID=UPI001ED87A3C|nr:uncharacterized protein LOC124166739 isoform X1 [Ischnura elegans]
MGEKICRLCLWREGEFYNIFTAPFRGQPSLDEQLRDLLHFEIVNHPRLPREICSNCYRILAFIADFKLSCSRVNSYLNELVRISPEISENGNHEQIEVSHNLMYEPIKGNGAVQEIRHFDSSMCGFPGCNGDDIHNERPKPPSNEESQKPSHISRFTSVISHGREWSGGQGFQIGGVSHAPVPWNYAAQSTGAVPSNEYKSSALESHETFPVVPSFDLAKKEEMIGKSEEIICIDDQSSDCQSLREFLQYEGTTNSELALGTQTFALSHNQMNSNIEKQGTIQVMEEEDQWRYSENIPTDGMEVAKSRIVENSCIDGSVADGDDCKGESESFPWEDEDTIELKLPYEEQQLTSIPIQISVPQDVISGRKTLMETNKSEELNFWSTCEKKPVELELKHECIEIVDDACDDDQEDAIGEYNGRGSVVEDPESLGCLKEKMTNHNLNIDVDINKAIYKKLLEMQDSDVRITTTILKDTALKVALEYGLGHFTASYGWLHSFIRRYEISQRNDEMKLPAYCAGITITNGYLIRYCCKELNESLYKVCGELVKSGVELNAYLIKDFARRIAFNEGLYEFSASPSWFKSFKKCYNIEVPDINSKHKT